MGYGGISCHAEVAVLDRYRKHKQHYISNKKLTLVVIRINKSQQLINSKPCKECISNIYSGGIRKIIYSDAEGNLIESKTKELLDETRSSKGTLHFR